MNTKFLEDSEEKALYLSFLKRARSLLKGGWTQKTYFARDKDQNPVLSPYTTAHLDPKDQLPEAVYFTIHGACTRAVVDILGNQCYPHYGHTRLEGLLKNEIGDTIKYNDSEGRTQEEILALFDKVIDKLTK